MQTNFGAGEIAPDLLMRLDTEQYRNGAKSLLNTQLLVGGGGRRRPGTWRKVKLTGDARIIDFSVDQTTVYLLAFGNARMDAYLADGTAAGSLTGCPWDATTMREMDYAASGNTIIVTHPEFLKVITRTGAATWTIANFPWFQTIGGRIKQPHYKVAPDAMTIQPSALTGTITLTVSADWWTDDHVGKRIRIMDREVLIDAQTDERIVTGTVKEALRPTQTLSVPSSSGFALGDVVEGETSFAKGEVRAFGTPTNLVTAAVPDAAGNGYIATETLEVQGGTSTTKAILKVLTVGGAGEVLTYSIDNPGSYSVLPTNPVTLTALMLGSVGAGATATLTFDVGSKTITVVVTSKLVKFQSGEDLLGPNGQTTISAVADATPAAVDDWTEQLYSDANGWPRCVEIHRSRIMFAGSAGARNAIAASSILNVYDFDVGSGLDADGFLETIGDSAAVEVRQLHSGEQLLALTDKGPYYLPETPANPLRPTTVQFNHFGGEWPISDFHSEDFDGGVLFASGSTIIKMLPTGNTSSMWSAREISYLAAHLIIEPTDLCTVMNFNDGAERIAVFCNVDGTLAVMMLVDQEKIRNFVPWDTTGNIRSVASLFGTLYQVVARSIDGVTEYYLEMYDPDLTLDCVTEYATKAAMDSGVSSRYGSEDVNVVTTGRFALGLYPPQLDELPAGPYRVGFNYERKMELLPPVIEDAQGNHAGDLMRIVQVGVRSLSSARFAVRDTELQAFEIGEALDAPPPLRTRFDIFPLLGWSREPTVLISQPDPLPLTVLAVNTEVAF
ncbi:MAG: hypothetical protein Q7R45_08435 [Sulfuricaulis sp.]|nr:hypothetical protein [Sulfuricaulis sp.]